MSPPPGWWEFRVQPYAMPCQAPFLRLGRAGGFPRYWLTLLLEATKMLVTKAQYYMMVLREDMTCHALTLVGKAASRHNSVRSVTEMPVRVLYDEVPPGKTY